MDAILYLDNNATTRVDDAVVEAMIPFYTEFYANPSATYTPGRVVKKAVDRARQQVASLLRCRPNEVIFTGGGTEADNTAIYSATRCFPKRKRVCCSACEHPAVSEPMKMLREFGYTITPVSPVAYPEPGAGRVNAADVERAIRAGDPADVALVCVMAANNETGVVNPVADIGRVCAKYKVPLLVDATQAVGKVPVDFRGSGATYMVCSAHKFHGPKGVGVLVVRDGACFKPHLIGGGQENGCRSGTENVPGIVGTGMAAEIAQANLPVLASGVKQVRDSLQASLYNSFPRGDLLVLGADCLRTPNTLFFGLRDRNSRAIQEILSASGIAVGTGSACSCLKNPKPSATVQAMNVPPQYALGMIRISLSKYNAPSVCGMVAAQAVVSRVIDRLRQALRDPSTLVR